MKKTFKRAGVAVLSMAMLLSMGAMTAISSSATGEAPISTKTVTVSNITKDDGTTDTGAKVGIYQVATRNIDGSWSWLDSVTPAITISGTSKNVVFGTAGSGEISIDTLTQDQVHDLAVYLKNNKSTFTNKLENNNTNTAINLFSNNDNQSVGYYLIVTEPGAGNSKQVQPTLISFDLTDSGNTDVSPKASGITVDKSITGVTQSNGGTIADYNNNSCLAEIGSTVSYSITTKTPGYATGKTPQKPFTIYDDPSDAIDIVANTVAMKVNNVDVIVGGVVQSGYTSDVTYTAPNGDGFTIAFSTAYLAVASNQNLDVEITFDATIGSDAILGAGTAVNTNTNKGTTNTTDLNTASSRKGNPNSTYIEYSNNYSTGGGDGTSEDTVDTYVGKIVLGKWNETGTSRLAGSKFIIKDSSDNPINNDKITSGVIQPTNSGDFDLGYLAPGTYTITETEAPVGYKIAAPTTFTISGTSTSAYDTFLINVSSYDTTNTVLTGNNSGNCNIKVKDPLAETLPGTGGMGTILFTVGGAAVVLLAGALFVVYMRRRKVEE